MSLFLLVLNYLFKDCTKASCTEWSWQDTDRNVAVLQWWHHLKAEGVSQWTNWNTDFKGTQPSSSKALCSVSFKRCICGYVMLQIWNPFSGTHCQDLVSLLGWFYMLLIPLMKTSNCLLLCGNHRFQIKPPVLSEWKTSLCSLAQCPAHSTI